MELKKYKRKFIADDFDLDNPELVGAEFDKLIETDLKSLDDLLAMIGKWKDLESCLQEMQTAHYTAMTVDTTNKEAEKAFLNDVENIEPIIKAKAFLLKKKVVESEFVNDLDKSYDIFLRNIRSDMDIFREESIPVATEAEKKAQEYQKITGGWMIDWDGEQLTRPQVMVKLEELDRDLREKAFKAWIDPHLKDREKLDSLYDELLALRQTIAKNAGLDSYREYVFKDYKRFDYTPDDCFQFHDTIKKEVVPLVAKIMEKRKEKLGLSSIRPWDLDCDDSGKAPIKPFADGEEFKDKIEAVFKTMDPQLEMFFRTMRDENLLDLDSRKGKAPGGYMADYPERKLPFIFMNAVGSTKDVRTLLHESGHAFNLLLDRDLELLDYLQPPMEFAEVASMSMELLAFPYFDKVYKDDEIERAKTSQLYNAAKFFPFMSMIDSFQHWVYTNPSTAETRGDKWASLEDEFRPYLDWSGMEEAKRSGWQYLHVFLYPFYYIEYGIAQLGALQVWENSRKDFEKAIAAYKNGLSKGGSRTLPDLFTETGIKFDMTSETIRPLMKAIEEELGL